MDGVGLGASFLVGLLGLVAAVLYLFENIEQRRRQRFQLDTQKHQQEEARRQSEKDRQRAEQERQQEARRRQEEERRREETRRRQQDEEQRQRREKQAKAWEDAIQKRWETARDATRKWWEQQAEQARQQEARRRPKEKRRREETHRWQEEQRRERQGRNWWDVLGTARDATLNEVKAAYRQKIKLYHPDRVASLAPEFVQLAEQRSRELNAALDQALREVQR
jgi:DnaJ domain